MGKIGNAKIVMLGGGGMPDFPLSISNGGTGNTDGYIRTGLLNGQLVGYATTVEGGNNKAMGMYAHAEGYMQKSVADYSHAEGEANTVDGRRSHAEGSHNTVSCDYGHVEGHGNKMGASAKYSHIGGCFNEANYSKQTVVGHENKNKSDTLFEVGNGTDTSAANRSNAFEVYEDGKISQDNGSTKFKFGNNGTSDGYYDASDAFHAFGGMPENPLSTAHGGTGNSAGYIRTGLATGTSAGDYTTAEGTGNTVTGNWSHAEGQNNTVSGGTSHVEGASNTVSGDYSHAEGTNHNVGGDYSHAEGEGHTVGASASHVLVSGQQNIANYPHQTVVGKLNDNKSTTLFEIGNGTNTANRSNAFEVYNDGKISQDGGTTKFKFGNNGTDDGYYDASGTFHAFGGSVPIATTSTAGIVKPDGSTITVDNDGTIHSAISGNGYWSVSGDGAVWTSAT